MLKNAHIPAILWTLFIASSCLLPASAFESFSIKSIFQLDKLIHFVLYFVFVLLWALTQERVSKKSIILLGILSIAYGILIEVLQSAMSLGRAYDVADIVANTIGCVFGVLSITLVRKRMPLFKKYLPFLRYLY